MYRVAAAKTYPGWGYMVDQGATPIWETCVTGAVEISGAIQSADYVAFDVGSGAYSFRLMGE